MELFLTLTLAHLFADFPLQTNMIARLKSKYIGGVVLHVLIYIVITALLLNDAAHYLPLLIMLGSAHFLIDANKGACNKGKVTVLAFILDQLLHILSMGLVAYLSHLLWDPVPQGILPLSLLCYAVLGAIIPAVMVCCWVWTINHPQSFDWLMQNWRYRDQILLIEQRFGLIIIGIVFWVLATQEFQMLLRLTRP